jgi:hypothetical protein
MKSVLLNMGRTCAIALLLLSQAASLRADSSTALIPIDSPVYFYLEKLADIGLISSNVKKMKPFSNAEAAGMLHEANSTIAVQANAKPVWSSSLLRFIPPRKPDAAGLTIAVGLVIKTRELLPRDVIVRESPGKNPVVAEVAPAATRRFLASANIPLDSPIYVYLDKLAGFGLINSDFKGIKPYTKAEAARLVLEAVRNISTRDSAVSPFALELVTRTSELLPREMFLRENPDKQPALVDFNPVSALRLRYVYLDGAPRSYERQVHDPGGDGVFGIGRFRPHNPYPSPVTQRGTEGTPLAENNNGAIYRSGNNAELRWAAEGHISDMITGVVEPVASYSDRPSDSSLELNRGYVKLGGGWLELEAGKDENWLGLGYRGAITLSNNSENLTLGKLSSPEPFQVRYIGAMKYSLIVSQLDRTVTNGVERQPWFYALKLSAKPVSNLEIGFNLGRQVGGPGVDNSFGNTMRGLLGGTNSDNSNGMAGLEIRYQIPWLRNTELYGEFSGEDTADVWPIAESYLAGFYIPLLTEEGRDDLRFEFFQGHQILYTNSTFPGGYLHKNMPLGHSQGGATQDFFTRYSHWFGVRNNLALEYFYTNRGMSTRMPNQAIERKHAGRVVWSLPIYGNLDGKMVYGIENSTNLNQVSGANRTNQLVSFELRYGF